MGRKAVISALASLGTIVALAGALLAAGCGSGSRSGASASSAKVVTPSMATKPEGNVTWCIGKDTTGAFSKVVSLYNQSHRGVHVKLLELPTSADEQRTQLVQREQAKSPECDVLGMDVIWTAEFASEGWLRDVTPALQARASEFIPATIKTVQMNGKDWAVPFNTNAGLIYYNKTKVHAPPRTWQQVYQDAKTSGGFAYQGQQYEGLTVNFLELLYSNGGTVLSPEGNQATIDSPQAQQVLAFMQRGLKDGAVPRATLSYMEEESRTAFETGKVSLLRNWPYVYALAKKANVPFGVEPLPSFGNNPPSAVLGGYNLGISTYSKNPGAALSFINYATSRAAQKKFFVVSSLPAVISSLYTDPEVVKAQPFAPELLRSVEAAKPRPVSPVYPKISQAIYKNVYSALSSGTSPQTALSKAQTQINAALKSLP
jgi:multiple sugar transport system substrate-binding protein